MSDGAYTPYTFVAVDCPDCGHHVEVGLNVHGVSTAECGWCHHVFDYDTDLGVIE